MPREIEYFPGWQTSLEAMTEGLLEQLGDDVAERAQANASWAGDRAEAITSVPADYDRDGPYVDVGYDKRHPGFVLWWSEVGTERFPPRPHLRPALHGTSVPSGQVRREYITRSGKKRMATEAQIAHWTRRST